MSVEDETSSKIPALPPSEARIADAEGGTKEARQIALGLPEDELRRLAATGEHHRNEKFRNHFERIALCSLWAAWVVIIVLAGTWLWHVVTPLHWLPPESVDRIQTLVTGGVIAGIAGGHIKRRLGS